MNLTIRGDTLPYVSMIEGNNLTSVSSPFKYRILVPFLASLLPFSPTDSLRIISYLSLLFCYLFSLLTCLKLGLTINQSAIGLLSVWASTLHLYNYHNPFLTDAFGLLILCIMLFALVSDSFTVFLIAALLGVLARETTIFLIPVWALVKPKKYLWQGMLLIVLAIFVLAMPRYFLASETEQTLVSAFNSIGMKLLQQPLAFGENILTIWGGIWLMSLIGILYLPNEKFLLIAITFVALLTGAFLTSLIATDTGRMFSVLTPVFVITNAFFYREILAQNRIFAFTFVAIIILQGLFSMWNIIFSENSWIFTHYANVKIILFVEITFVAYTLFILRNSLIQEIKEKAAQGFKVSQQPLA